MSILNLRNILAEKYTYELLDCKNPPTCIFYPDDLSYSGGVNAVRSKDMRIPDDLSMIGYDGIKLSQMLSPKLTTLKQGTGEIGKLAARELIDCINNPKTAIVKTCCRWRAY